MIVCRLKNSQTEPVAGVETASVEEYGAAYGVPMQTHLRVSTVEEEA
jgi:hypothetical protein